MVFKTHPLQDIASCKAWDKLVELEKMKNIVMIKIVEVMSNYEKTIIVGCVPYEHRRSPRA